MTRAKFKRLFMVLLVPLLAAGGILAFVAYKANDSITLRCEQLFDFENCRSTGWGDFDERVARNSPAWFDVNTRSYDERTFPRDYVSASQRQINDVQILDVTPYVGTEDGPGTPLNNLRSFADQKISILFGSPGNDYPSLNPLGCNELTFDDTAADTFVAGLCGIPNGVAEVKFRVGEQDQQNLMRLKVAIDDEITDWRGNMITRLLILIPIFVVFFLIISGLVWLVRRSAAYVSAG